MAKPTLIIPLLSEEDIKRFWSFVDVRGPDECWLWKGGKTMTKRNPHIKYGKFSLRGKTFLAHRIAHFLQKGPLFNHSLLVCHSYDVFLCCNGVHLFSGTYKDNKLDSVKKGRHAFGDRSGLRVHPERAAHGDRHGYKRYPERWIRKHISYNTKEAIRAEYASGRVTQKDLAQKYNISQPYVHCIIKMQ